MAFSSFDSKTSNVVFAEVTWQISGNGLLKIQTFFIGIEGAMAKEGSSESHMPTILIQDDYV